MRVSLPFPRGWGCHCAQKLPSQAQAAVYAKLFALFVKRKDAIDRVTFWGLNDAGSWRAGQNPLVFDRDNRDKARERCLLRLQPALRTVEMLFSEADRFIRSSADQVTVIFDQRLGIHRESTLIEIGIGRTTS